MSLSTVVAQEEKELSQALMAHSFEHEALSWDGLLTNQVGIYFDCEADYLAGLPIWKSARNVLDIGCGNGDFLARLAETFPGKQYSGIDLSDALIDIAHRRQQHSALSFQTFDIQAEVCSIPADVVLLRFVCQHLANPRDFFAALRRNCPNTSHIVVAEPCFAESQVDPDMPELSKLIGRYDQLCRSLGNARSAVSSGNLGDLCGPDWHIAEMATIRSRSRPGTAYQYQLEMTFNGWITAIEATRSLPANFSSIRDELRRWFLQDGARAELALKYWLLEPARISENG
jgi:SAM-dependent methyltransferase